MTQMQQERQRELAPLDKSLVKKQHLFSIDQSKAQQDFLPRSGFRSYPERAHQRARQERDRRLGRETASEPIIDLDSDTKRHVCDCTCDRLPDCKWFEIHPRARSGLRNTLPGDDAVVGRVLVTKRGAGMFEKTYAEGIA
jgi:hypothetical protein